MEGLQQARRCDAGDTLARPATTTCDGAGDRVPDKPPAGNYRMPDGVVVKSGRIFLFSRSVEFRVPLPRGSPRSRTTLFPQGRSSRRITAQSPASPSAVSSTTENTEPTEDRCPSESTYRSIAPVDTSISVLCVLCVLRGYLDPKGLCVCLDAAEGPAAAKITPSTRVFGTENGTVPLGGQSV